MLQQQQKNIHKQITATNFNFLNTKLFLLKEKKKKKKKRKKIYNKKRK